MKNFLVPLNQIKLPNSHTEKGKIAISYEEQKSKSVIPNKVLFNLRQVLSSMTPSRVNTGTNIDRDLTCIKGKNMSQCMVQEICKSQIVSPANSTQK